MNLKENKIKQDMLRLLSGRSKHSQYQRLPEFIEELLPEARQKGLYERERLNYCMQCISLGDRVVDIGGNTGYFSFEAIQKCNAEHVDYYEGNQDHAEFVKIAAGYAGLSEKISVHARYFDFENDMPVCDTCFNLNVMHHLGDDFDKGDTIDNVKEKIINAINKQSAYCGQMVFQMGFNWGGNVNRCLFEHGTKKEVEEYIRRGTKNYWDIVKIGVAEKSGDAIEYVDVDENNNDREDVLGEFLNRPIFILRSRVFHDHVGDEYE